MRYIEFDQAVYEMIGLRTLVIKNQRINKSMQKKLIGLKIPLDLITDSLTFRHMHFQRIVQDDDLNIYVGPIIENVSLDKMNALKKVLKFNSHEVIEFMNKNEVLPHKKESVLIYRDELKMLFRLEKSILLAFKSNAYDEAHSVVRMVLNYQVDETRNTLLHWKNLFKAYNNTLIQVSTKLDAKESEVTLLSEDYLERASHIYELTTLKKLFFTVLRSYYDLTVAANKLNVSPMIDDAINYIHEHFSEKISTHIISDAISVNYSHLSRQFKKEVNTTITHYIQNYRIEEAKLLIEQGNLSITEIALRLGFKDIQYFTRTFKKLMHMTPSEYAKNL